MLRTTRTTQKNYHDIEVRDYELDDYQEETQNEIITDFLATDDDYYYEALVESPLAHDFKNDLLNFLTTYQNMNTSSIEMHSEHHFIALENLYKTSRNMFKDYTEQAINDKYLQHNQDIYL